MPLLHQEGRNTTATSRAAEKSRRHASYFFIRLALAWSVAPIPTLVTVVLATLLFVPRQMAQGPAAKDTFQRGEDAVGKQDWDRAITCFTEVLRQDPKNPAAYFYRGFAHFGKKDYDQAVADYTSSAQFDPNYSWTYNNRGNAYLEQKEYAKALADYTRALRLDVQEVEFYNNRGICHRKMGKFDQAVRDHQEAVRLDPRHPNAYNCLAWLWATCPDEKFRDGERAVAYARKACDATDWKNPFYLDTLAAAYAERGDFREAIRWGQKALQTPELTDQYGEGPRRRLKLYAEGKAFREQ